MIALAFFTAWYSTALSVALAWNTLWGYWLVVKVYLDIAIEIAAVILGQDLATWYIYITSGTLALTMIANGISLFGSVVIIALLFWTDNGDYIIETATYWYNYVLDLYD